MLCIYLWTLLCPRQLSKSVFRHLLNYLGDVIIDINILWKIQDSFDHNILYKNFIKILITIYYIKNFKIKSPNRACQPWLESTGGCYTLEHLQMETHHYLEWSSLLVDTFLFKGGVQCSRLWQNIVFLGEGLGLSKLLVAGFLGANVNLPLVVHLSRCTWAPNLAPGV